MEIKPLVRFALLIPCKNGAPYLPRLFASIRAQTRPFDEIWLFDDGSTDDSADVAASLGARVIRSVHSLGPSAARNRLSESTNCDWLHFHDADDTLAPEYLAQTAAAITPQTDVVVCNMVWVEESTGKQDSRWMYETGEFERDAQSYLIVNTIGGINGLYRRSALHAIGGFDENRKFWEDTDLNLRLARNGARFVAVREDLVYAYRRTSSYSNSNLAEVWRSKLALIAALLPDAPESLRRTIAIEAERIAERIAVLKRWTDVPGALRIARQAGGDPPTTASPVLQLLKHLLPATWTFRLQHALRQRAQT